MYPEARPPLDNVPPPPPVKKPDESKHKVAMISFIVAFGLVFAMVLALAILTFVKGSGTKKPAPIAVAPPPPALKAPKIELRLLATGLPNPTDIVSANNPKDNRLFIIDQSGVIRILKPDGSVLPDPFLDITPLVNFGGEMGLLGMTFSPKFSTDGFFYINYIDKGQNTVIARMSVAKDNPDKADPASAQTVLTVKQPYVNHNAGDLVFGPDNYLYVPLGDGGDKGDPGNRAQDALTLFGKILRLDVSTLPYKVPPTNPFVKTANKKQLPEIWDLGLRNPWRISFDRKTNELYIADVGQGDREEVNVEPAGDKGGHNYGWRCYEGTKEFNTAGCGPISQYVFPAFEYDHLDNRCSLTGGYVYRGEKYPQLQGKYYYADYCGGQLYTAEKASGAWKQQLVLSTPYQISTFGENSTGELFFGDYKTGAVYSIIDSANPPKD